MQQRQRQLQKMAIYSIAINAVQIVAVLAVCILVFFERDLHISALMLRGLLVVAMLLVVYGAALDIREALNTIHAMRQADMLTEAYGQLETLNNTLRAQRHDFMNHLQVVYSLMEMQEQEEAATYIERVYGDIVSVGRALRTQNPAVNALLQAKMGDCERRGLSMEITIRSAWEHLPLPGWEMCRVLGNLIDNAMDALEGVPEPRLEVELFEDVRQYGLQVRNNGPMIPEEIQAKMLTPGYTTKATGQGMGLHIVDSLIRGCGGRMDVTSAPGRTCFEAYLPRAGSAPLQG